MLYVNSISKKKKTLIALTNFLNYTQSSLPDPLPEDYLFYLSLRLSRQLNLGKTQQLLLVGEFLFLSNKTFLLPDVYN